MRVVKGAVLDVAVDVRKGSPTYGRHVAVELTADNHRQLFISEGIPAWVQCAERGGCFSIQCDEFYAPGTEGAVAWD